MPIERSAGALIFRKNKEIKYLLLHYPSTKRGAKRSYWDFPKGHIEKGEKIEETVKREVFEETGIKDIQFIKGFKEEIRYFFRDKEKTIFKTVIFLLAQTKEEKVKISSEHIGYLWLPFEEAMKKLSFRNSQEILKKANDYLKLIF
jgi:8-oxo-dGTP pyrophosphatase MutT (NUDIX family)